MKKSLGLLLLLAACTQPPEASLPTPDLSNLGTDMRLLIATHENDTRLAVRASRRKPSEAGVAWGRLGMLYHANDLREAADVCYEQALRLAPRDVRWPHYRAHLYLKQSDYANAELWFRKALELERHQTAALVLAAELTRQRGRLDEANVLFEEALAQDAKNAAALAGLARIAIHRKNFEVAGGLLERARGFQPDSGDLFYLTAMVRRGLGDREGAAQWMARRDEAQGNTRLADPLMEEIEALEQTGLRFLDEADTHFAAGRMETALEAYAAAVGFDPNHHEIRVKYAYALMENGRNRDALAEYEEALRLQAGTGIVYYNMGGILLRMGRVDEAEVKLNQAVTLDPALADAWLLLADLARGQKRFEKAANHYARALEAAPKQSAAHMGYALSLIHEDRYAMALEALQRASRILPQQQAFTHMRARLLAAAPVDDLRNGQTAAELLAPMIKTAKPTMELAETVAMAMAEAGRFELALKWQDQALTLARRLRREDYVPVLNRQMSHYRAQKAWREPWRKNDPLFHQPSYR